MSTESDFQQEIHGQSVEPGTDEPSLDPDDPNDLDPLKQPDQPEDGDEPPSTEVPAPDQQSPLSDDQLR